MIANEIYLLPKYTLKNPGPRVGNLIGGDLVDAYYSVLFEELEHDRVEVRRIEREDECINPLAICIILSIGESFAKSQPKRNLARISTSLEGDTGLHVDVGDALAIWGKLYSHAYSVGAPTTLKRRVGQCSEFLEIEPIQINAPDAGVLSQHLHRLGRDLSRAIADHSSIRKRKIMPAFAST